MSVLNDTIFALASASGRAGVAVLRISGPKSESVIEQLSGSPVQPRQATLRLLRDPSSSDPIDRALLCWFPAPKSFTGEDIVEIHSHGSQAVVAKLLSVLASFDDFRLAEPGEFARRAFENGKMDLTSIEGLADLINAETQGQRRQALRQSEGALGKLYESWREHILTASALIEAMIDFSDEEDIIESVEVQVLEIVRELHGSITDHLESAGRRGEQMRDGFRMVIAGAPNVGKSSLLNVLAKREAAIVTSEPGTTRDIIEVHLIISGFPVLVMDTAGIRETTGAVEQEGIKRAFERLSDADLVLWLIDPQQSNEDTSILTSIGDALGPEQVWRILSKADLRENDPEDLPKEIDLAISSKTNEGISVLIEKIERLLGAQQGLQSSPLITRARHRIEVVAAQNALSTFMTGSFDEAELRAEDLRQAANALGRLTGRIDVEELLGKIFGEFCIGK
ncbi:MAG: tRNA uridine-5-carboxymethylaminomethyl(34) synthesis GTPase MnmE [bacterium]|nr:tRNA uridine-5-carboxymethylaminomethyl(34) synthesis GTPase MnmE [bacterium]